MQLKLTVENSELWNYYDWDIAFNVFSLYRIQDIPVLIELLNLNNLQYHWKALEMTILNIPRITPYIYCIFVTM